mmetsp:Transcript_37633/g.98635  ORF Transcript_37633/g.98635 Transcript_37633/m.98635 type:complete len:253 (+) Transcript_37633:277-1035(+)
MDAAVDNKSRFGSTRDHWCHQVVLVTQRVAHVGISRQHHRQDVGATFGARPMPHQEHARCPLASLAGPSARATAGPRCSLKSAFGLLPRDVAVEPAGPRGPPQLVPAVARRRRWHSKMAGSLRPGRGQTVPRDRRQWVARLTSHAPGGCHRRHRLGCIAVNVGTPASCFSAHQRRRWEAPRSAWANAAVGQLEVVVPSPLCRTGLSTFGGTTATAAPVEEGELAVPPGGGKGGGRWSRVACCGRPALAWALG